MSRRFEAEDILLAKKINEYKQFKDEESNLKKAISPIGSEIKEIMQKRGLTSFSSENWTAKITVKENKDFNELAAIEILRSELSEEDFKKAVKTKEYIDDDALESIIYNGNFEADRLSSCFTDKAPTVTLRISKKK